MQSMFEEIEKNVEGMRKMREETCPRDERCEAKKQKLKEKIPE